MLERIATRSWTHILQSYPQCQLWQGCFIPFHVVNDKISTTMGVWEVRIKLNTGESEEPYVARDDLKIFCVLCPTLWWANRQLTTIVIMWLQAGHMNTSTTQMPCVIRTLVFQ